MAKLVARECPNSGLASLPKRLKLDIEVRDDGDNIFIVRGDKARKRDTQQRQLCVPMSALSAVTLDVTMEAIRERLQRNACFGFYYRNFSTPWNEDLLRRQSFSLYNESLLQTYLELQTVWRDKELRVSRDAARIQDMRNAMGVFVLRVEEMRIMFEQYMQNTDVHVDRVDGLIACPVSYLFRMLSLSPKKRKKLLLSLLPDATATADADDSAEPVIKVDIHFHIEDILLAGLSSQWTGITRAFLDSLRGIPAAVLLTFCRSKQGKIEFDVPGGKRDVAETPLECMWRETWEETGIPTRSWLLKEAHAAFTDKSRRDIHSMPKWTVISQEECEEMTSFTVVGTSLLFDLLRSGEFDASRYINSSDREVETLTSSLASATISPAESK